MTPQEQQQSVRKKGLAVAERIVRAVEDEWGLASGELEASRGRWVHDAEKRAAAYLIRVHTRLGWFLIGQVLGRRNMTVRSAVEASVRYLEADDEFARRVLKIERKLGFEDTVTGLRKSA